MSNRSYLVNHETVISCRDSDMQFWKRKNLLVTEKGITTESPNIAAALVVITSFNFS